MKANSRPVRMLSRTAAALVAIFFAVWMTASAEATSGDHMAAGSGHLMLMGVAARTALQLSADADIRVTGLVAQVQLRQRFHNNSSEWVNGEYRFPLPSGAAVHRLRMTIGERVIEGQVQEKAQARQTFERAKAGGRKAGLVEQRRANLFSNRIANIGPDETVEIELHYTQRVDFRDGVFSLRLPTTLTRRYTPDATGEEAVEVWNIQLPNTAPNATALQAIRVNATINMGLPLAQVEAPYHSIKLTRQGFHHHAEPAAGEVAMDRDFLLQWRPLAAAQPRAALFHERIGAEEYALLMVVPPEQLSKRAAIPREVIFVIDTSGSMGGGPMEQARASLAYGLSQLDAHDRFNIIAFSNQAQALFDAVVPASEHHLSRAREFLRHLRASGGTEMRSALEVALPVLDHQPASESTALRQLVFITDGAVGNELELFQMISRRLGDSRFFTVGIGSAPNGWFMRKAAEVGRGDQVLIGDITEVQARMETLFKRLSQPLLRDLQVDWPVPVETYPTDLPDLYPGEPLWLTARSEQALAGSEVQVGGRSSNGDWHQTLLAAPAASDMEQAWKGIGSLWAKAAIEGHLDRKILGVAEEEIRAAVLPIALKHQLLSPYTSFVAVEQQPSRPGAIKSRDRAVPNLRPHGQSPQLHSWPGTATGLEGHALYGFFALLIACVFWRLRFSC